MSATSIPDAIRLQTIDYLDQIVCMALRAQRAIDALPEIELDREEPDHLEVRAKIEDGIAACRDLVSQMGWLADIASTGFGAEQVATAEGWLLPDSRTRSGALSSLVVRGTL